MAKEGVHNTGQGTCKGNSRGRGKGRSRGEGKGKQRTRGVQKQARRRDTSTRKESGRQAVCQKYPNGSESRSIRNKTRKLSHRGETADDKDPGMSVQSFQER